MRRFLTAAPVALLSAACATRPWTPSVSVAYWAQDVPPSVNVALPSYPEAALRWQLPPENPWARWQKMTLLSALDAGAPQSAPLPDVRKLDVVSDAENAAARIAAAGLPPDTMWIADLRGAASVAFGAALSRASREPVAPVLTFNNWPAENEFIPAEETLSALVAMQPRLPQPSDQATRPVILLDAWRLAFRDDEPDDEVTDNRYMLGPLDLPDAASLRAAGISRIVYVVEDLDDAETEEDDLHEAFMAYQAAGISIFMVDLRFASKDLVGHVVWNEVLVTHYYPVRPRITICSSIHFYARSRGGFGGVHGFPSGGRGGGHIGGFGG
jgi:hypothetical protein